MKHDNYETRSKNYLLNTNMISLSFPFACSMISYCVKIFLLNVSLLQ